MLKNFFNPERGFFRFCGKLADILMLSLLWLVCCLPVITIGTSTAALYNSAVKCVRNGENQPYVKFRDFMKANFKAGIPVSILIVAIAFLFSYEIVAMWHASSAGSGLAVMMLYALGICSFIPLSYLAWLTSIFSRYEFSFGQLAATSFKFIFAHPLASVVMGVLNAVAVVLCYGFVFPLTFLPCLLAVIYSFFIEKCFDKHTKHVSGEPEEPKHPMSMINNRL